MPLPRRLLNLRGTILRSQTTSVDGIPTTKFVPVAHDVPARLDLSYTPPGADPRWVVQPGRAADRKGTLFLEGRAPIEIGDRFKVTYGRPAGTYEVRDALNDVPGRTSDLHHYEAVVTEVAQPLGRN